MNQYEPFRMFLITCSLIVAAVAAATVAFSMKSDDPVRDQLRAIASDCARPDADLERLQARFDHLIETHGVDFLIAEKSRGDAFVRAGLEVQRCRYEHQETDRMSTENPH